jgi:hypothetical protein
MHRKLIATAVVVLTAALLVPALGLAAKPKTPGLYSGQTGQPAGEVSFGVNAYGPIFSAVFYFGCKDDASAGRITKDIRKLEDDPSVKVKADGSFSWSGTVRSWRAGRSIGPLWFVATPKSAGAVTKLSFKGKFVSKTKAVGTFRAIAGGCDSGSVPFTVTG